MGTTKGGDGYASLQSPTNASSEQNLAKVDDAAKPHVPLRELFRYADATDRLLMAVGTLGAIVVGAAIPLEVVLFGSALNSLSGTTTSSDTQMSSDTNSTVIKYVIVGACALVGGVVQMTCWSITGARQIKRIRSAYARAILTKEIGWFDVSEPMQLSSRAAGALVTIQDAIGCRMGDTLRYSAMVLSGIIIGFVKGWLLALVMLAVTPFLAISVYWSMTVLAKATQHSVDAVGKAGAVAQESLENIKTVHMFNALDNVRDKFEVAIQAAKASGIRKALAAGWGECFVYVCMFGGYALGLFFGAWKISSDRLDGHDVECTSNGGDKTCYNGGQVVTVFFSILIAGMTIGQAGPCFQAIFGARSAAYSIFEVINRPSEIDPTGSSGDKLAEVQGEIEIRDVTFAYPSRPDSTVCRNYSLTIHPGETIALVGPSGSGKSTIVGLVERFYDPLAGSVLLDGHDIRNLNVQWLRQQISLVGQEPTLFAMSIKENIRHGRPSATDDEVIEAAKMANAYDFIIDFPNQFDTPVGERGAQLSGGQKQRIAIARAIIKNPRILLLDEATSALDTQSERIVQQSLDRLLASSTQRTTILVAHRLSTVRNATRIAVHHEGAIVELGPHDELMEIEGGHYRRLIEAQKYGGEGQKAAETSPAEDAAPSAASAPSRQLSRRSSRHSSVKARLSLDGRASDTEDDAEDDDETVKKIPLSRIWKLTLLEWKMLVAGTFTAVINGAMFPTLGYVIAKIIVLFFRYDYTSSEMRDEARKWALIALGLGIVFGLFRAAQCYSFGVVSQRLVARVRRSTFSAMVRQEIGWFDLAHNGSGALVSRLTSDTEVLQSVTSDSLNQNLLIATTSLIALGVSIYYSWQMTLAMLATFPLSAFTAVIEGKQYEGSFNKKNQNDADTQAESLLAEAISSIRTIASFGMEDNLSATYGKLLDESNLADRRVGVVTGLSFGVSQGLLFWINAFLFWLGGVLISHNEISFLDFNVVQNVIMTATFSFAMTSQNKTGKAKVAKAAQFLFSTIDRVPAIDASATTGAVLGDGRLRGDLTFQRVAFAYPARPDKQVYKDYNLVVRSGQTVALVGASGSGKSTAIALLERFYDPASGSVCADGVDIRELSLPWLRERISLVSQEPVLFSGSIADNIGMGKPGATRAEVEAAARQANAFDFIANFPDGFDTQVGDRGAQVSGGQKQRIAIARAILRDPDVLLLDEATSALDNESERVVQASLDALMAAKKRTTIVVAHRLSTIQRADVIFVTEDGGIVEQGTHAELMQRPGGVYRALVANQVGGDGVVAEEAAVVTGSSSS